MPMPTMYGNGTTTVVEQNVCGVIVCSTERTNRGGLSFHSRATFAFSIERTSCLIPSKPAKVCVELTFHSKTTVHFATTCNPFACSVLFLLLEHVT